VLWLAAFLAGLAACAVGITYPLQHSAFALPAGAGCAAGLSIFNGLYLSCFTAITSCIIQASCVTLAMWIMGSRKRLPPPPHGGSVWWCRGFLLVGVVFCGLSLSCVICVVNLFVFVRVSRFACLGVAAKLLVVVGDVVAAVWGLAVFAAGSYIALFCQ
jgi:uncharacterized membrane protein